MFDLPYATPESLGVPSAALLRLMRRLAELEYVNSIKLLRHGRVCLEGYVAP